MPLIGALDWSRAAVLTTSPATMPSPSSGRAPISYVLDLDSPVVQRQDNRL